MSAVSRVPPFLAGIVAVLAGYAVVGRVAAQPAGPSPVVDVCVDDAGVMRLPETGAACSAGERRLRLRGPEKEKECEPLPTKDLGEVADRVAQLEGRGGEAQASPVIQPFEVVNEAGIRVFRLEQQPAVPELIFTDVFNGVGMQVAAIAANAGGGAVTMSNPQSPSALGALSTTITANNTPGESRLAFRTSVPRGKAIELGRRENGRFGLSVFGGDDKVVAFAGESLAGSGLVAVTDTAGTVRASMFRDPDTASGLLRIQSAQGKELASLSTRGPGGSGLLQLRNNRDQVVVEAGTLDTGVGAVITGPAAFNHGIMFLGLPASYIVGKKQ